MAGPAIRSLEMARALSVTTPTTLVVPEPFESGVSGIDARNVERNINTVTVYAWRMAAATWDGCAHVAAEINLPLCGA